jgi:hypothetical protein
MKISVQLWNGRWEKMKIRKLGIPRKWINIYTAADALASNFMDDGRKGKEPKAVGIQIQGVVAPRIPETNP